MTKRCYIRIISYSLTLAFVLSAFAIVGGINARNYKAKLEASYQQSLAELSECLDLIETNLKKSEYANSSAMLTNISQDLYSECANAKDALSNLPINQMKLNGAYKFLSQASDYATYISQKISGGETISDEEYDNIKALLSYATAYSSEVEKMVLRCNSGGKITENEIEDESKTKFSSLTLDFDTAESSFENYPTLLYDGPFADAVINKEPLVNQKYDKKSKEECLIIAAKALGTDESNIRYVSASDGKIPSYEYAFDNYRISITAHGGFVNYIINSIVPNDEKISEDNAISKAKSYLEQLGYENMVESYYSINNNICTINFAYSDNDIICYADLIKVGVSMSDGSISSIEAGGYLSNHNDRDIESPTLTKTEASEILSSHINVIDSKLSVIPKDNGKEVLCYEFHCSSKAENEESLVYVNAKTKQEENILLLLYSDNGTLTK